MSSAVSSVAAPHPAEEPILIDAPKVACDGGTSAGHPRVFLTVGKDGKVVCPYCSKLYVLKPGVHVAAH